MSLVLWSGGFDSTLVLYDLCVEAKRKAVHTWPRALSINHQNVCGNRQAQVARNQIHRKLASRGLEFERTEVNLSHWDESKFYPAGGVGLQQPVIWLPLAILYLQEKEDLYAGWTRGDDVMHYLAELRWSFQYLRDMTHKDGKLHLPLEWTPKFQVLQRLRKAKLVSLPWTCEQPKAGLPCGGCKPCRDLKTARYRLRLEEL